MCFGGYGVYFRAKRKSLSYYATHLKDDFILQTFNTQATMNYHYFPIIFESELQLIEALKRLNHSGIFPRRYFYPSLDELSFLRVDCVLFQGILRVEYCVCLCLWI